MSFDQLWSRLEGFVRERGSEPWLFFPRRFDWRWLSWQEGLRATQSLGETIEAGLEERSGATRALFADRADAAVVLAWLAASRRGLPFGWLGDLEAPPARALSWSRGRGEDDLKLDLWWESSEGAPGRALQAVDLPIEGDGRREIAFFWGPASTPGADRFLGWALASGAALALEPHRPAALASAAWVRPTVLWLGAEPGLVEGVLAATGRLRRGLFSRLRVVVAPELGSGPRERLTAHGLEVRLVAGSEPREDLSP